MLLEIFRQMFLCRRLVVMLVDKMVQEMVILRGLICRLWFMCLSAQMVG